MADAVVGDACVDKDLCLAFANKPDNPIDNPFEWDDATEFLGRGGS